jgi:outer membrane lipoprotein SlyB
MKRRITPRVSRGRHESSFCALATAAVHILKRIAAIATGAVALNGGIDSSFIDSEEINMSNIAPAPASASGFSRPAALIGGATALVALTAIATTLVVSRPSAPEADVATAAVSAQAMLLATKAPVIDEKAAIDDGDEKPAPRAAQTSESKPVQKPAAKPATKPAPASERTAAAAPACSTCGVVEAVTPYQQKGEGTGIGAVAGGVIGGVLGNQVGGGNGKKAMTVIGAVGGGMAGHEIEKRQRATTMYSVKVRMQDGTVRTVNQATAPTVGQKVTVEGSQVKARA